MNDPKKQKVMMARPWMLHQVSDDQLKHLAYCCDLSMSEKKFSIRPTVANGPDETVEVTWRKGMFGRKMMLRVGVHIFAIRRKGQWSYVPYSAIHQLIHLKVLGFVEIPDEDDLG